MKKRMIIAILGTSIALGACTNEIQKKDPSNDVTTIEKTMPVVYKGLHIEMESYVEDESLKVKAIIENQSDKEIPLHYKKERFATISLTTEDELIQEVTLPFEQDRLKSKESVVFEAAYALPQTDKEYMVQTKLHLESQEEFTYQEEELVTVDTVKKEKEQELVFLPKGKVSYIYENKRNEETTQETENFRYFKDGFVQSTNALKGTTIYYVDQKGVYYAFQSDQVKEDNLIGQAEYNKQLLLGFPLKLGTNWERDGVHYEITALDQVIQTPFAIFDDAVEVTSNFGTGVKYYFQKDIGLLQVRVKNGDKWEITTQLVNKK